MAITKTAASTILNSALNNPSVVRAGMREVAPGQWEVEAEAPEGVNAQDVATLANNNGAVATVTVAVFR
jgi:hypothetical protein